MKKIVLVFVTMSLLLSSCMQDEVIHENDMVQIFVKTFITDATVISPHLPRPISKVDSIDYYAKIYEPMGYTEQQFENTLTYYANNPEKLNNILDKVINELARIETEMGPKSPQESQIRTDSVPNLWTDKTSWSLPVDGQYNLIPFRIPTVGLGFYTLSAEIRVFADDGSVNPGMLMYFHYNDGTERGNISGHKTTSYKKDGEVRVYRIENSLINPNVTHIVGYIMDHSPREGEWSKHAEVNNIVLKFVPLPPSLEMKTMKKAKIKTSEKTSESN